MQKWKTVKDEYHNINNILNFHRSTMHHKANMSVNHIIPVIDNLLTKDNEKDSRTIEIVPAELKKNEDEFFKILEQRRTSWQFETSMNREQLFTLLTKAFGISQRRKFGEFWVNLKTYASAGALYSVEPYIYINDVEDELDGVIWKYDSDNSRLVYVADTDICKMNGLTSTTKFGVQSFEKSKIILFFVADFKVIFKKYGMLSYRLVLLESGHMCSNLQMVSTKLGYSTVPIGGFYDLEVKKMLKLDHEKVCLYMAVVG